MKREHVDVKQFKKVLFIYNSKAGKQFFGNVQGDVGETMNNLRHLWPTGVFQEVRLDNFEDVLRVGQKACQDKMDWVIVAGGDGTLRALVEVFVENNYWPYVSVFPAGTVNLVAKELQQHQDPERWLRRVERGGITPVWLGCANDRIFLTVAGIGVDSLVVDSVTEAEKKYLSKFAYVRQGSILLRKELMERSWKYEFQVMLDDDGVWREASSVIVAKSRYYAGRYALADGASLTRPALYVCLFTGSKKADFLRYAALIVTDMIELDRTVHVIEARHVRIRSNEDPFVAELDGDSLVSSPLDIRLIEQSMKFIS